MIGDAAYELVKKRTYQAMSIIIGLYSIVLVGILFIGTKKMMKTLSKMMTKEQRTMKHLTKMITMNEQKC